VAADELVGRPLSGAVPPMAPLVRAAQAAPDGRAEGQVEVPVGRRTATFFVRLTREEGQPQSAGYVLTFDDMTALVTAQRTAAWADVARRIAHEIKNPLTPIQLSAERLKRKYLRQISQEPEIFTACTDTIVRQVGDLRRMVDEFSAFARMPAPSFAEEDVAELVEQAVLLQEVAHAAIRFERVMPPDPVRAICDGRLLVQVLTNLLQNAVDAIDGRETPEGGALPQGWIRARLSAEGGQAIIEITDNGRGLPTHHRERLTEPYVTTRAKGTGLGLAIVKRIIEDHAGTLALEDAPGGGAMVRVAIPLARVVATADRENPAAREARHGA
jgi:two-component system nitrogen regulation sensor histidine kinase NtrY